MAEIENSLTVWAKSIQKRLSYAYEESASMITHGGLMGSVREAIIRDILRGFLPASVEIGTGQIVDAQGNRSKQVDVVVARGSTPVFRFPGGISVFLRETALATVEVKSMLDREKLSEALDNSHSVKNLVFLGRFRSRGPVLFDRAVQWIEQNGGLDKVDRAVTEPSRETNLEIPEDIKKALHFAQLWLHWISGSFRQRSTLARLRPLIGSAEFDLFANLLASALGMKDTTEALLSGFDRAEKIREPFFEQLYDNLARDYLPPVTIVLAYKGYENLRQLVEEVITWYDRHRSEVEWDSLPTLIMNHKMVMVRHFNEYHCVVFPYPVLFLINAVAGSLGTLSYQLPYDAETNLATYFDLGRILGDAHPQFSADYFVWSIPLDGSSKGEIIRVPADPQRTPPGTTV